MFNKPPVSQRATPNFDQGRAGHEVIGICFHIAAGSRDAVVSWFANPDAKVSAHFLVCRDGSIDQFVDEADTAWAQGILDHPNWPLLSQYPYPNRVLISIEHEGTPEEAWTEPEYQADLALCLYLCERFHIEPRRPYLLGHYELDSVNRSLCPGPNFPWQRLLTDLQLLLQPGLPAWLPPVLLEAQRAGVSDGSRPLESATRAEALAMVMRAVGDRVPPEEYLPQGTPREIPSWLLPYIGQALAHHITTGGDLGELARRVDVMAFAVRALAVAQRPPAAPLIPSAHWWELQIYPALAQGLGISDGSRPGEICTRGEAIAIAMAVRLHGKLRSPA